MLNFVFVEHKYIASDFLFCLYVGLQQFKGASGTMPFYTVYNHSCLNGCILLIKRVLTGGRYDYVHPHGVCIGIAGRSAVPLPPNRSEIIENTPGHDINTNLCPYLTVVMNTRRF